MNEPIERYRAADPAADLGPRSDARAEQDLRALLARPAALDPGPAAPPRSRRSWTPVLVTAVVAAALVVGTVGLLAVVRPTAPVADPATASPTSAARVDGCRPAAVLPWKCGTYRSTFGDHGVTGPTGGPKEDPLELSITVRQGGLLLLARSTSCLAAEVPMRVVEVGVAGQQALERAGTPRFSTSGCTSSTTGTWARRFLAGALRSTDAISFGTGASTVVFQYEGAAPIGQPQLPRNDLACVPAHVEPFDCGTYHSTAGSGSVAFLGTRPYRLTFAHDNAELEAHLSGRCNALFASLSVDGSQVVTTGVGGTTMGCLGQRGEDDDRVSDFFSGVLTWARHGRSLTFTASEGSATFTR